jgi:hypothetical protein
MGSPRGKPDAEDGSSFSARTRRRTRRGHTRSMPSRGTRVRTELQAQATPYWGPRTQRQCRSGRSRAGRSRSGSQLLAGVRHCEVCTSAFALAYGCGNSSIAARGQNQGIEFVCFESCVNATCTAQLVIERKSGIVSRVVAGGVLRFQETETNMNKRS